MHTHLLTLKTDILVIIKFDQLKIKSMVYSTVIIIMVINSCIAPTYLLIPTAHISNAIEITVLKEQDTI